MTDQEIRRIMSAIAAAAGLDLSEERIERALPVYRSYLQAMESIRRIDLPLEAEPAGIIVPRRDGSR